MQTTVSILGIHCASCAAMIKDVSSDFPQIQNVDVDIEKKTVTLEHDEEFDKTKWSEDIESLGDTYKVHPAS